MVRPASFPLPILSILTRQEQRGRAPVGFRDNPNLFIGAYLVARKDAEVLIDREFIFLVILICQIAPITPVMVREQIAANYVGLCKGFDCARCRYYAAQREAATGRYGFKFLHGNSSFCALFIRSRPRSCSYV